MADKSLILRRRGAEAKKSGTVAGAPRAEASGAAKNFVAVNFRAKAELTERFEEIYAEANQRSSRKISKNELLIEALEDLIAKKRKEFSK